MWWVITKEYQSEVEQYPIVTLFETEYEMGHDTDDGLFFGEKELSKPLTIAPVYEIKTIHRFSGKEVMNYRKLFFASMD